MSYDAVSRPIARHPRYPLPDERLREALRPFAEMSRRAEAAGIRSMVYCDVARLDAARAALAATDEGDSDG